MVATNLAVTIEFEAYNECKTIYRISLFRSLLPHRRTIFAFLSNILIHSVRRR